MNTPYIIAEIGINHNGCFERASDLVRAACIAGADAVKFQMFDRRTLNRPAMTKALLRGLDLSPMQLWELAVQVKEYGKQAIVTPFGYDQLAIADSMDCWDGYKVSHAESSDEAFVDAVHDDAEAYERTLFISLAPGVAYKPFSDAHYLWCCPDYPTDILSIDWAGVGKIGGFSDHTGNVKAGGCAVTAGARVIEAHITFNRNAAGLDHKSSINADNFASYVRLCRSAVTEEVLA